MTPPPLEAVAESLAHIVWLADPAGSTDYVNERTADYTGMPRHVAYGWGWVELVHPDDAPKARLGWQHATRTATRFELTYRLRRNDGEYRWHALNAHPVRREDGSIARWIGTADDLEELARHLDDAERFERQRVQLQRILDSTSAPGDRGPAPSADAVPAATRPGATVAHVAASGVDLGVLQLSDREVAVAQLVARGHTNAEIAELLSFSLRTIEASRARLRSSLGIRTRAELVRWVDENDLGDPVV